MKNTDNNKTILKGDLHCHTTYSDGTISPGSRVIAALNHGMDFLAITDHDTMEGTIDAMTFKKQLNLPIILIPAVEFYSDLSHILVYGIKNNPFESCKVHKLDELKRWTRKESLLLVLAHPAWASSRDFWISGKTQKLHLEEKVFDAVEVINMHEDYTEMLDYYLEHGHFSITAGSDSHGLPHILTAENWLSAENKIKSILDNIKAGNNSIYISKDLKGHNEPTINRSLWLGKENFIKLAKQEKNKRIKPENLAGVQVDFSKREALAGEKCSIKISSEKEVRILLRAPELDIKLEITTSPSSNYKKEFIVPEALTNKYIYCLIEYGNPKFYSLTDLFVQTPNTHKVITRKNKIFIETKNRKTNKIIEKELNHDDVFVWNKKGEDSFTFKYTSIYKKTLFQSWEKMIKYKISPITKTFLKKDVSISAEFAISYNKNNLYLLFEVHDTKFCQPFTNRGIWDGDCIRIGLHSGNIGNFNPKYQPSVKTDAGIFSMFDLALTPEEAAIQYKWKLFFGKTEDYQIDIQRVENKTIYKIQLKWDFIEFPKPSSQEIMFFNAQFHHHDGVNYNGYFCIEDGIDLGVNTELPFQKWPLITQTE
ncbi:MAG: PHP domain-containing protein [Verrucomicrobiota bacterium]|nr:PHP domain-containing protein [Verrucomicrobiota bacterium]